MRLANRSANSRATRLVCVLALLVSFVAVAGAQTRDDLQSEIERTDAVIERATQLVAATGSQSLAQAYLEQAIDLQSMARSAFNASLFADAARLTLRARERAFNAIRLAQQAGSDEFLRFMLERTDVMLDRIAPMVRASEVEAANRMLDTALEMQRRAREALAQGQFRAGLSLTFQARDRALQALRLAENAGGRLSDRARRAVERTEDLLAESRWLTEAGDKAARSYQVALRLHTQAEARLAAGDFQAALRLSQQSRERLLKALNDADRPLGRQAVESAVERSRDLIGMAQDRVQTDRHRQALERARDHQARAERNLAQGKLAAALAEVRAVRTILERAGL